MEIRLDQTYSFCQLGRRSNQEDARFPDCDIPEGHPGVFIVCDGVGGQDKGEIASRTVADAMGNAMKSVDLSEAFTTSDFKRILSAGYNAIDRAAEQVCGDIATTLTFLCFHSVGAFAAHIGDSRIYHIRPGVGILHQTSDHSLVNALVHSGNITPEEAIDHPQGNIITRCVRARKYAEESPATTLQITDIEAGDYFFMCTDGVEHQVDSQALYGILSGDEADRDKIRLIATLSRDSSDNNTAYLIHVAEVKKQTKVAPASVEKDNPAGAATEPLIEQPIEAVDVTVSGNNGILPKISRFFNNLFK